MDCRTANAIIMYANMLKALKIYSLPIISTVNRVLKERQQLLGTK